MMYIKTTNDSIPLFLSTALFITYFYLHVS